jgi:hypothetical protein
MGSEEKLLKPVKDPLLAAVRWVKARNQQEKIVLGIGAGFLVRCRLRRPTIPSRQHPQ